MRITVSYVGKDKYDMHDRLVMIYEVKGDDSYKLMGTIYSPTERKIIPFTYSDEFHIIKKIENGLKSIKLEYHSPRS